VIVQTPEVVTRSDSLGFPGKISLSISTFSVLPLSFKSPISVLDNSVLSVHGSDPQWHGPRSPVAIRKCAAARGYPVIGVVPPAV
jgi:hypothetical protein